MNLRVRNQRVRANFTVPDQRPIRSENRSADLPRSNSEAM